MIAEVQAADGVMGFVVMAAVCSGVFILLHLAWRQWRGQPLLPPYRRPFRSADAIGLCLIAFGVFAIQQFCGQLVTGKRFAGTEWGLVGILLALNFGVVAYYFAVRRVMRPRGRARTRVGQGLLVAWASLPVVYGVFFLVAWLSGIEEQQDTIKYMAKGGAGWEYLAIFAVAVAPLLEEIAFRGLLYPAIRERWGPLAAILATSVLFGMVHVSVNVMIPLGVFGVFLAILVERTGSILPCVVAHAAFNSLTVAQIVVAR